MGARALVTKNPEEDDSDMRLTVSQAALEEPDPTLARTRTRTNHHDVIVVIPAYNEELGIALTLTELESTLIGPNYLVVDGCSTDGTSQVASGMGVSVLAEEERGGKGNAMALALQHIPDSVNYVVFTDADYTYPAKYLPDMVKLLDEDPSVGMVDGNRFPEDQQTTESINTIFHLGNKCLALAHRIMNGVKLKDPFTGLRVVRWALLKDWKPVSKGFDIEAELNHYVQSKGYRTIEVPIEYRPRIGDKKLGVKHGLNIMKRIILLCFTNIE
jgi:glycosyltransferase involved in cell wall biosynthesis